MSVRRSLAGSLVIVPLLMASSFGVRSKSESRVAPSHPQEHAGHSSVLPVVVDGALTPGAISDALAYAHFMMAVAYHKNAPVTEIRRRDALLQVIELDSADNKALVDALEGVKDRLDSIGARRSRVALESADGPALLNALRTEERQVLGLPMMTLTKSMTPAGLARLDDFIRDHVKRRIKVYGDSVSQ